MSETFAVTLSDVSSWVYPLLVVLLCLMGGWLMDRFLLERLRNIVARTPWEFDDALVDSVEGLPIAWGVLLAGYILAFRYTWALPYQPQIQKTLLILFVISMVVFAARMVSRAVNFLARRLGNAEASSSILVHIARFTVYGIGVLVILQTLGISILPILAALGVGGLAVSLALQDSLSNLFAGLQIILSRQIQPGDFIALETGQEGIVVDISLRNTTLRQLGNNILIVPNAKLASSIITNFHNSDPAVSVRLELGVSYASDLGHVESVALAVGREVIQEVSGGSPDFEPVVRFQSLGESAVRMTLEVQAQDYVSQFLLRHELLKRLKVRFEQEGIEMPYPARRVYLSEVTGT